MSHGRTQCGGCQKVIARCRCMEDHGRVLYSLCDECRKPKPKTYAQVCLERAEKALGSFSILTKLALQDAPELAKRLKRACAVLREGCCACGEIPGHKAKCSRCKLADELEAIPEEG